MSLAFDEITTGWRCQNDSDGNNEDYDRCNFTPKSLLLNADGDDDDGDYDYAPAAWLEGDDDDDDSGYDFAPAA